MSARKRVMTTAKYLIKPMPCMHKEKEVRGLAAIVGEESLSERDKKLLKFAAEYEDKFVRQGAHEDRSIEESLDLCWKLFELIGESELTRISPEIKEKYYGKTHKS